MSMPIHIVGGGLSGSEAAWQLLRRDIPVIMHEMRPVASTEAHRTDKMGELVCSNSLRADDSQTNAIGLLHEELRRSGSLIMQSADAHQVPAGGALAVDREAFSETITQRLMSHPLFELRREPIEEIPDTEAWHNAILATGPLTSPALAENLRKLTGEASLSFFDAIAPIVYAESIDMTKAWKQSRYDKGGPGGTGADYINCAMDKEQYETFLRELLVAPKVEFKEWEKNTPYFEGCLPIEVMAERGEETLRFGPMKPVGLTNPHSDHRPYAVVQLRQDNKLGTLYNLVGFQTKLKHGEQTRVFRLIPGLENAEFARLGGIHRNTFVNGPRVLERDLSIKAMPTLCLAGQVTGVEGYVESTSIGLLAGLFTAATLKGVTLPPPPRTTALGALLAHITLDAEEETFQPMNVNFGLFPPPEGKVRGKHDRKLAYTARGKEDFGTWLQSIPESLAV